MAYLGPAGTYTEEALLADESMRRAELLPFPSIEKAIAAADACEVDAAFVPIENTSEGPVRVTLELLLSSDLLVQSERLLAIEIHLLGLPGSSLAEIRTVVSFGHALAQCREHLARVLPAAALVEASSTAEAARLVSVGGRIDVAALAGPRAAAIYRLTTIAAGVQDKPAETRFVLLARGLMPVPTARDVTSVACLPRGSGGPPFVLELPGHVADQRVAAVLAGLRASLQEMRLLGSFPATRADVSARVWA